MNKKVKFTKTRFKSKFEPWYQSGQKDDLFLYSCSRCGSIHDLTYAEAYDVGIPNYCSHCGARVINGGGDIDGRPKSLEARE